jgi:Tol biopolymer transport system component/tRNA A-37 threonylcarbamoyl transferase component Bud32
MGEVYKARDTRLERTVAIKVLPEHLSTSPESRQRFEREAKTISQLSHPNICALYDVGNQNGAEFLVMEYLEGETLAERLLKGALPLDQTLRNGMEIAGALDRAHRAGIVHRDLKPGNVMLTKSGVKLLDFGLAKLVAPVTDPITGLSMLPTTPQGSNLTAQGTILGTFQYMAPEQLEGKEADTRTDIFAFGSVLYEMATGKKAFSGSSQASLIGAILHTEPPPISAIEPMSPPALDRVVKTCLAKEPDDRFQTAHDAKLQLQWIAEAGSQAGVPAPVAARRKSREKVAWGSAALLFVLAALATFGYLRRTPVEARAIRSFLLPPEKTEFNFRDVNCGSLTISPDGRYVTFATKGPQGKPVLWLRALEESNARPIPGTDGATFPFWSPDSRMLAFFADGKLKKVDLAGSPPLAICDAPNGRSGGWNRDGVILFSSDTQAPISRVAASGGAATSMTQLDTSRGETTHRWATFLPDGEHFLYMAGGHNTGSRSETNAIYIGALNSTEKKLLFQSRSNVAYASGHLLYMREGVLVAQSFDPRVGRLRGGPVPVSEGVQYEGGYFRGNFSASENGLLVFGSGDFGPTSRLQWFDRAGKPIGEPVGELEVYTGPLAISPDGKRIAAEIEDSNTGLPNIWLYDARGVKTRFTFGGAAKFPVWSPDGTRIAYAKSDKPSRWDIVVKPSSGGGQEELLHTHPALAGPTDWSRDGRYLAITAAAIGGRPRPEIWMLPLSGDRKAYKFLTGDFALTGSNFSPDGRWFCYTSDESGKSQLYVVAFPGPGGKWQVSTGEVFGNGGGIWTRGGKEIEYLTRDLDLVSVPVNPGPAGLEFGSPTVLFRTDNWATGGVAPDGGRFLGGVRPDVANKSRLALVTNWTTGLDKK